MIYKNTLWGRFIGRPNRFIAYVEINGEEIPCHVKNTGRCRELLTESAKVVLCQSDNPKRKTQYDLIAVLKGDRLINIDSQVPNTVFREWVLKSGYFKDITYIRPEYTYGNSRLDFYIEASGKKILAEVKGVTLEENNVVSFPDAPTQRGTKHLNELIKASGNGYEAYIVFIVQMENVNFFTPNQKNDPDFSEALRKAVKEGVNILCLDCKVSENEINANNFVKIQL